VSEYKETLNLPKTDFPMKANLANREPHTLARWHDMDLYGTLRKARQDQPKFILHDGPPYANGEIHIGHAVNKVLKDIIVKAKTMSGYDAPYIPGWDCHGLPIELQVEKKIGKAGAKVDAKTFRSACRDYAKRQVATQSSDFQRLGIIGDWDNPYLTMDYRFEADTVRALGRIIAAGHVHKGVKPVHWCIDCGSALAEAEVEYQDKTSPAIDVRFAVLDDEALLTRLEHVPDHDGKGPISIPIWTTTPWTLPANQAVALHPELDYVMVQCEGDQGAERLVMADSLVKDTMMRYGIENYRIIASGKGQALEGLKVQHPFYDREVPIILGNHVTTEAGTGAVHTAPGHGQDDYVVGQRYRLHVDNPVGSDGKFLPGTPLFAGEFVLKANDHVIDVLKTKGALLHETKLNHSYPHCWRHRTPIIFRATPQWFISMDQQGLRHQALAAIKNVTWTPDWGQARIDAMVTNRPDWCISRQRTWGVPIPLFVHKNSGELHPNTQTLIETVAQRMEQSGIDAWFDLDKKDLLDSDADDYDKVNDILDVWFDSGVTHVGVIERRSELTCPADLYLEGSDQHRGWFQSSLLASIAIRGAAPYRAVLTHGFAVDAKGMKMSKSRGNTIAPQKVVNVLGADIVRLWVAAADYRGEMTVSDEILKRMADAYRRIRNTSRFLLANLSGFDPHEHLLDSKEMLALDRWLMQRATQLQQQLQEAYDNYEFHVIYQKIHNFCSVDMGSFYLDVIKDRQYTTQRDSIARRSTQTAMYHVVEAMVRWLAPILSFTAEEIWQRIPGKRGDSVLLATWYELPPMVSSEQDAKKEMDMTYWQNILTLRDAVSRELEKLRVNRAIGSSLDAEVDLYVDDVTFDMLSRLDDELRFVLITSEARIHRADAHPEDAVHTVLADQRELWIKAMASKHEKCIRCWHHRKDVGQHPTHPKICHRCIDNVDGLGEQRHYA